jgi:hypothetical protein
MHIFFFLVKKNACIFNLHVLKPTHRRDTILQINVMHRKITIIKPTGTLEDRQINPIDNTGASPLTNNASNNDHFEPNSLKPIQRETQIVQITETTKHTKTH